MVRQIDIPRSLRRGKIGYVANSPHTVIGDRRKSKDIKSPEGHESGGTGKTP
jgi:hypothetical protein